MVVQRSMIAVRCARKLALMAHLSVKQKREEKEGTLSPVCVVESISWNGTEQNKGLNHRTKQIEKQIGEFLKANNFRHC